MKTVCHKMGEDNTPFFCKATATQNHYLKKKPYRHISTIFLFSFFPSGGVTLVGVLPTGLPRLFEAGFVNMYLESLNFIAIHHNEEGIGHVNHIFQAYDARVVHQLKDPCLVQHIGGVVAAVEGGDGFAHIQVILIETLWKSETLKTQPDIPSGPLPQHLTHRVVSGQLGKRLSEVASTDIISNIFSFEPKRDHILSLPNLLLFTQMPLELFSLRNISVLFKTILHWHLDTTFSHLLMLLSDSMMTMT